MLSYANHWVVVKLLLGGGIPLAIYSRITTRNRLLGSAYHHPSIKCGLAQSLFKNKNANFLHCYREIGVNMGNSEMNHNNVANSEVPWKKQLDLIRKMRKQTKHAAEVKWEGLEKWNQWSKNLNKCIYCVAMDRSAIFLLMA